jgi:hypothetical protein
MGRVADPESGRIHLFSYWRPRNLLFFLMRIRILLLIKMMRICDRSIVSVHGPSRTALFFDPRVDFIVDPDLDPSPHQNDANLPLLYSERPLPFTVLFFDPLTLMSVDFNVDPDLDPSHQIDANLRQLHIQRARPFTTLFFFNR